MATTLLPAEEEIDGYDNGYGTFTERPTTVADRPMTTQVSEEPPFFWGGGEGGISALFENPVVSQIWWS